MEKYNNYQKMLIVFSFLVTFSVILSGLLIVTEPRDNTVLGIDSDSVAGDDIMATITDLNNNEVHIKSSDSPIIGLNQIDITDGNVKIFSNSYNAYFSNNILNTLSGAYIFETANESLVVKLENEIITILPNTVSILDANQNHIYVGRGAIIFDESKIAESGQYISKLVDRIYKVDKELFLNEIGLEAKNLGYDLYEIGLLDESLQILKPKVIY